MSVNVLVAGAVAATAASAVLHQKNGRTVVQVANDTGNHLKWNIANIRDGLHDDLVSFKNAFVRSFQFKRKFFDTSFCRNQGDTLTGFKEFTNPGHEPSVFGGFSSGYGSDNIVDTSKSTSKAFGEQISNTKRGIQNATNDIKQTGSSLAQNTQEKVQQSITGARQTITDVAQDASDKTQSLFNWGLRKAEKAGTIALEEYDKANKTYLEAMEQFNASKKGIFGKGNNELKFKMEEAKMNLDNSRRALEHASTEFKNYKKRGDNHFSSHLDGQDTELNNKGLLSWIKSEPATQASLVWTDFADQAVEDFKDSTNNQLPSKGFRPTESQRTNK